jgi:hypothetical protein
MTGQGRQRIRRRLCLLGLGLILVVVVYRSKENGSILRGIGLTGRQHPEMGFGSLRETLQSVKPLSGEQGLDRSKAYDLGILTPISVPLHYTK